MEFRRMIFAGSGSKRRKEMYEDTGTGADTRIRTGAGGGLDRGTQGIHTST
jgi:hypothetical protein